jgi:SH3 domain protein
LSVIEAQEGWSHITTPSGLDGWLESHYLVDQPIARHQIINFRQETSSIKARNTELSSSLSTTQAELNNVKTQLDSLNEKHSDTALKLSEIRKISANSLNLHAQNQQLLKQNKMLQSEIDVLTATTEQLTGSRTQKWFFYGALAVFMGAILSIIIPRLKPKRRGYSEWG